MSTVYNKKYFTDLLEKLVLPLKEHYSEECANLYLGHTGAAFEDRTIPMEGLDRKSTRLNSSHDRQSRMPSSA